MEATTAIDDNGDYHTCSENSADADDSENGSFISLDSESGYNIDMTEKNADSINLSIDQRRMNSSHDSVESIDTVPEPINPIPMAPEMVTYRHQVDEEDMVENDDTVTEHDRDPPESFLFLFLLISFGYMLPWTSLGSLISYYKATYSASFYVKLYCAYYIPGLPIALLQYRYDTYMDSLFSSRYTYLFRGLTAYSIMMGVLVSLIYFRSENLLIILFGLLGKSSYLQICITLWAHTLGRKTGNQ
jgi:hypothetical protein